MRRPEIRFVLAPCSLHAAQRSQDRLSLLQGVLIPPPEEIEDVELDASIAAVILVEKEGKLQTDSLFSVF